MRRLQRHLGVALTLALALSACGGGDDDNNDATAPTPSTTPSAADTALPQLTGKTLEVAAVWTGTEQKLFQKVLDAFKTATGATVKFTSTGDDIATVLGTRVSGGNAPDVAILPQPGLLKEFAGKGALQELTGPVAAAVDTNYAPVWRELGSVNGKLYGVWYKAANKSTVWYSTKAFQDAGVEAPQFW